VISYADDVTILPTTNMCDTCSNNGFPAVNLAGGRLQPFCINPLTEKNDPEKHESSRRDLFLVRCWWQYKISGFLIADWFEVRTDFREDGLQGGSESS
jgi:hypothetical protein